LPGRGQNWDLGLPKSSKCDQWVPNRALRDWLWAVGRDWDPFFPEMSVFGRDQDRFQDWKRSRFSRRLFRLFGFFQKAFFVSLTVMLPTQFVKIDMAQQNINFD
jgi:hypothetical protein